MLNTICQNKASCNKSNSFTAFKEKHCFSTQPQKPSYKLFSDAIYQKTACKTFMFLYLLLDLSLQTISIDSFPQKLRIYLILHLSGIFESHICFLNSFWDFKCWFTPSSYLAFRLRRHHLIYQRNDMTSGLYS